MNEDSEVLISNISVRDVDIVPVEDPFFIATLTADKGAVRISGAGLIFEEGDSEEEFAKIIFRAPFSILNAIPSIESIQTSRYPFAHKHAHIHTFFCSKKLIQIL